VVFTDVPLAWCARDNVVPLRQNLAGWFSAGAVHRHPDSRHSSQGVVDDRVNEVVVSTVSPGRSAIVCCQMDQG